MERYDFVKPLGEGAYGVVWKGMDKSTGQSVAVKRFKEAHENPEVMALAMREISFLKISRHPNVVHLHEAFQSNSGKVYLVMEHVEFSLLDGLRKHPNGLSPLRSKLITFQLLQACAFMHANHVMHRDLKPSNVLLHKDGTVKLCDFGLARSTKHNTPLTPYVVTRWYRAPELLVGAKYGAPCDIWAVGCLLAEMLTGTALLPGNSTLDQLRRTVRLLGPLPAGLMEHLRTGPELRSSVGSTDKAGRTLDQRLQGLTPEMRQVVEACLQLDPARRLTALEVLRLPFFYDVKEHLAGTTLQAAYDEAYQRAVAAPSDNSAEVLQALRSGASRGMDSDDQVHDDEEEDDDEGQDGSLLSFTVPHARVEVRPHEPLSSHSRGSDWLEAQGQQQQHRHHADSPLQRHHTNPDLLAAARLSLRTSGAASPAILNEHGSVRERPSVPTSQPSAARSSKTLLHAVSVEDVLALRHSHSATNLGSAQPHSSSRLSNRSQLAPGLDAPRHSPSWLESRSSSGIEQHPAKSQAKKQLGHVKALGGRADSVLSSGSSSRSLSSAIHPPTHTPPSGSNVARPLSGSAKRLTAAHSP